MISYQLSVSVLLRLRSDHILTLQILLVHSLQLHVKIDIFRSLFLLLELLLSRSLDLNLGPLQSFYLLFFLLSLLLALWRWCHQFDFLAWNVCKVVCIKFVSIFSARINFQSKLFSLLKTAFFILFANQKSDADGHGKDNYGPSQDQNLEHPVRRRLLCTLKRWILEV